MFLIDILRPKVDEMPFIGTLPRQKSAVFADFFVFMGCMLENCCNFVG